MRYHRGIRMFPSRKNFDQSTYIKNVNHLIACIKEETKKQNPSPVKRELRRKKWINVADAYKTIEAFAAVAIPKDNQELNDGGICRALVTKWQKGINAKYYNAHEDNSKLWNFKRRIKWMSGLNEKRTQELVTFVYPKNSNNYRLPKFKKNDRLEKKLTDFFETNNFGEIFKDYIDDAQFFSSIKSQFTKKLNMDFVNDDKISTFAQYFVQAVLVDQLNYVRKLNKVFECAEGAYNVENQNYAVETGMSWVDTYPVPLETEAQKEYIKNFDKPKTFIRFYANRHVIGLHIKQKSSGKIVYKVYDPNETKGVQKFNNIETAVAYVNKCLEGVGQNLECISVYIPDVAKDQKFIGNYPELEKLIESLSELLPYIKSNSQTKLQTILNSFREANKIDEAKKELSDFLRDSMLNLGNYINDEKHLKEFTEKLLLTKNCLENRNTKPQPKNIIKGLHHTLIDVRNTILEANLKDLDSKIERANNIKKTAKILWDDYSRGRVPLITILRNYSNMLSQVPNLKSSYNRINDFYETLKSDYNGKSSTLTNKPQIITKFEQRSMFNAAAKSGAFYWLLDQAKENAKNRAKYLFDHELLRQASEDLINLFKNDNGEVFYTVKDLNELASYLASKNGASNKFEYNKLEKFRKFKEHYSSDEQFKAIVDFLFKSDLRLFINANDANGYTPLYEAIIQHHFDTAHLFIQNGALINRKFKIKKEDSTKEDNDKQQVKSYLKALVDMYSSSTQTFRDSDYKTVMLELFNGYDSDNIAVFSSELISEMYQKKDYDPDIIVAIYNKFNPSKDSVAINNLISNLVEDFQYNSLNEICSLVKTKSAEHQAYFFTYLIKEISRQQSLAELHKELKFALQDLNFSILDEIENTQLHNIIIHNTATQGSFLERIIYETAHKLTSAAKTVADETLSKLIDMKDQLEVEITPFVLVQLIQTKKYNLLEKLIKKNLTDDLCKNLFQDLKQRRNFGLLVNYPKEIHDFLVRANTNNKPNLKPLMRSLREISHINAGDQDFIDYKMSLLIHFMMLNFNPNKEFNDIKTEILKLKSLLPQDSFKRTLASSTLDYYRKTHQNSPNRIAVIDKIETFSQSSLAGKQEPVPQPIVNAANSNPPSVKNEINKKEDIIPVASNNNSIQIPQHDFDAHKILSRLQEIIFTTDWPVFGCFKLRFFGSFKIGGTSVTLCDPKNNTELENTITNTMDQMLKIMKNQTKQYRNNHQAIDYLDILRKVYQEGNKRWKRNGKNPSHQEKTINNFYQLFSADSFAEFQRSIENDLQRFPNPSNNIANPVA